MWGASTLRILVQPTSVWRHDNPALSGPAEYACDTCNFAPRIHPSAHFCAAQEAQKNDILLMTGAAVQVYKQRLSI